MIDVMMARDIKRGEDVLRQQGGRQFDSCQRDVLISIAVYFVVVGILSNFNTISIHYCLSIVITIRLQRYQMTSQ